ncbi:MAG TPA: penicillin-binding transpeptidase domain-containing protein [Actinomycetota bacterium]|nr:penicillin-binding transpeptidase domain-containing protein [Actinomycetota bacterium]
MSAAALVVIALAACTSTPAATPVNDSTAPQAAKGFVDAWNDADYDVMSEYLSPGSALDGDDLQRLFDRLYDHGALKSIHVDLDAPAQETRTAVATAPYSIRYRSTATRRPVKLEGDLELHYSGEDDAWQVVWSRSLLFPGEPEARDFDIAATWLRRGSILDRHGRKLATGPVDGRRYPYGSTLGSTVGHIGPASKEDAATYGVSPGDLVGGSGIERGLQEALAGTPSTTLRLVDRKGDVVRRVGAKKGKPGRNVKTTLDIELQRVAQGAFGSTTGGVVVMDPHTGNLLAVVSSSPFDPNNYVGAEVHPFNRALDGRYPPGSSMKVVTASAAIDTGTVTPDTQLSGPAEFRGVHNFESGEFGQISFATALQHSVNTAFAQVALKLGAKKLSDYAERFGFNRVPEMPLEASESSFPYPETESDLMWGAIGQARVLATPLQMATVAATVANDGKRMEPRISYLDPPSGERIITKKTANTMTDLMVSVVVGGTGQAARLSGVDVAGKTGTAEVDVNGERKNHAWFICFAPAEDPDIAIAVVSEYGGIGGEVAAPIARQILSGGLLVVQSDEFHGIK